MAQNTISDELNRLIQAKADIKTALESKGVTIGDSSTLDEFPALIEDMPSGGGSGGGTDTSLLSNLLYGAPHIDEFIIPSSSYKTLASYTFFAKQNIDSVRIQDNITRISTNAFELFFGSEVTLPNNLEYLGAQAFFRSSITHITIPQNASCFMSSATLGIAVFQQCSNLTDVSILCPVRYLTETFFAYSSKLKNIYIPDCSISYIPLSFFRQCTSLEEAFIPNMVNVILQDAFRGCTGIKKVCIPNLVTNIGNNVFNGCSNITEMILLPNLPPVLAGTYSIDSTSRTFPIYVKNEVVDTYKNAGGNWSGYASRITPLASATFESSTNTVQASGRDTLELYIDSSLIDSSVYTFTPGATDEDHTVTVKSIDSSLGLLDTYETTVTVTAQ